MSGDVPTLRSANEVAARRTRNTTIECLSVTPQRRPTSTRHSGPEPIT
jgi:hypothetical protein